MVKNFMLVALRGIKSNTGSAFQNVLGLSVGLSCFILITLFVQHENSYDTFHENSERIFRIYTIDQALGVSSNKVAITNPMMPVAAAAEIPEVENSTRLLNQGRMRIEDGIEYTYAEHAKYVDANFFNVFDFKLEDPNSITRFEAPRKLVMTKEFARKTFRDEEPIGKTLTINDDEWEVTGILKDSPDSHLQLDLLLSMYPSPADSNFVQYLEGWHGLGMVGYITLNSADQKTVVEGKMKELANRNEVPEFWIPQLQPLEEVHLRSSDILFDAYNEDKGDIVYVVSLSVISVLVILIAAFNFMNLATAKSSARAKEVAVRKVMGSSRIRLVAQHLGESLLITFISLLFALLIVIVTSAYIDLGLGENPALYLWNHSQLMITIFLLAIGVGVISGIYPAFVLSGQKSSTILRGKFQTSSKGIFLRKSLVVAQFLASVTLIISTMVITKQLNFLKNKNLGFAKDQVITFSMNSQGLFTGAENFRDKLLQYNKIENVGFSSNMPGRTFGRTGITPEGVPEDQENWIVSAMSMDEKYFDVMGMEILEGRNYSREYGTDQQQSMIVNQAFIDQLGWESGVGKKLTQGNGNERTIIGVVKNFHFASMRHTIEPLMIFFNPGASGNLSLKINDSPAEVLDYLETTWKETFPNHPFEYQFFDEEFGQMFQSDENFSTLVMNFTWLAIFIASLGLFGLSSYTAIQRRKEIGIRKVLGSKVSQIVMMLSKEFLILISIAILLAWPIAYFAVSGWLADFQYKIELTSTSTLLIFFAAGVLALVIGISTVIYQTVRAALANPVNSLRDE